MKNTIRPETLIEGQVYTLQERGGDQIQESPVIFVAYTSCPGIVVVRNGSKGTQRCARECLVLLEGK